MQPMTCALRKFETRRKPALFSFTVPPLPDNHRRIQRQAMDRPQRSRRMATVPGCAAQSPESVFQRTGSRLEIRKHRNFSLMHPTADWSGALGKQPENTMLQIILIGAALSHVRPEPPDNARLPTDPLRFHRERWRCTEGRRLFWHALSRTKY